MDVLVLDRRLPGFSGPEIANRLEDIDFDGRAVVMSAYEPDEHLGEGDGDAYLKRPIRKEEFVEAVTRTVPGVSSGT